MVIIGGWGPVSGGMAVARRICRGIHMKTVALRDIHCGLLAGVIVTGLVGCVSSTITLEGHRAFPRKPAFTIEPREYTTEELARAGLRTDGVYMRDRWHPPESDEEAREYRERWGGSLGSEYYRFWANGRNWIRTANVELGDFTAEHADSFEWARVGDYQILPDGSIVVERYVYDSGLGRYTYHKAGIQIQNDEIWNRWGGETYKGQLIYLVYRFRPVPGMKAEPDW